MKMPRLGALPFVKSKDPAAAIEADLKQLQARHGRLAQRLSGVVDDYDRVAAEQRRLLVERDEPSQDDVTALTVELRGISDQRSVIEKAMNEVDTLIEDARCRLTVLRDQAARQRVADQCEQRATAIDGRPSGWRKPR